MTNDDTQTSDLSHTLASSPWVITFLSQYSRFFLRLEVPDSDICTTLVASSLTLSKRRLVAVHYLGLSAGQDCILGLGRSLSDDVVCHTAEGSFMLVTAKTHASRVHAFFAPIPSCNKAILQFDEYEYGLLEKRPATARQASESFGWRGHSGT